MTYIVHTHSGKQIDVELELFDAKEYEAKLNDNQINVVEIGGVIFSRIDLKMIEPKTV